MEGVTALGPHLAKLASMTTLHLTSACLVPVLGRSTACVGRVAQMVSTWLWMSGNKLGDEGAKVLGPYLGKLTNMTVMYLSGTAGAWLVCCIVSA